MFSLGDVFRLQNVPVHPPVLTQSVGFEHECLKTLMFSTLSHSESQSLELLLALL